jgi:hypothetical protein
VMDIKAASPNVVSRRMINAMLAEQMKGDL